MAAIYKKQLDNDQHDNIHVYEDLGHVHRLCAMLVLFKKYVRFVHYFFLHFNIIPFMHALMCFKKMGNT